MAIYFEMCYQHYIEQIMFKIIGHTLPDAVYSGFYINKIIFLLPSTKRVPIIASKLRFLYSSLKNLIAPSNVVSTTSMLSFILNLSAAGLVRLSKCLALLTFLSAKVIPKKLRVKNK